MKAGYVDPGTGIACHTTGLAECIEKGKQLIRWDEKRKAYQQQTGIYQQQERAPQQQESVHQQQDSAFRQQEGAFRRGVGMAIFSYKTGVYPISLETASCRMILNQDGSAQLQMGATEIGQGGDTVFTQMAADTSGLRFEDVHIVSFQDTDVTPFDTGAYASRQTYVSGKAIQKTAALFKEKILDYSAGLLRLERSTIDLKESRIVSLATGEEISDLAPLALEAFYSLKESLHITAEATVDCKDNTYAFGACFAEVEVDLPLGKVKVLEIYNVHDSGKLINPQLAEAQVHGGMSMGLGYAMSEQMLYDDKGRLLNGNFLDYKIGTSMDMPDLGADFVETDDPTGPFGNKALGEPPAIPQAAAIRNAVFHATGVALDTIPMNPQRLADAFAEAGLYSGSRPQNENNG
jgi:xanthine dehydrogenase molybdenum-binding subunit